MYNFFIKILFVLLICTIFYLIYKTITNLSTHSSCSLDNFDIDDLVVTKRTPEYSNLINKMIDDKSFIFTKEQVEVLKNPQQIFKLTKSDNSNSNSNSNISNISDMVYINCKNNLDNQLDNEYFSPNSQNNIPRQFDNDDILNDVSDLQYEKIKKNLKNDISNIGDITIQSIGAIDPTIPFNKNYLNNYYLDIYGNRVNAKLSDYIAGYYTLINQNNDVGLPVKTQIGHSNFIIPDQYNYDKHFTNGYNIDWDRIINPIGYSM